MVQELFTAVHHRLSVYAKLWVLAEDGSELDTLASMAAATECDLQLDTDMRVSVFSDRAFFETPLVRAAIAERRLRCSTFFMSEDTAVLEFGRATKQLAKALASGGAVLAAALLALETRLLRGLHWFHRPFYRRWSPFNCAC